MKPVIKILFILIAICIIATVIYGLTLVVSTQQAVAPSILPYDSGVHGTVMLGPTCPVMRNPPDSTCADKPYATFVVVFRSSDPVHAYAMMQSDSRGQFSFKLPPGHYTLGAGESNLPRCDHPTVTVGPTGYASTTISCDTGIR